MDEGWRTAGSAARRRRGRTDVRAFRRDLPIAHDGARPHRATRRARFRRRRPWGITPDMREQGLRTIDEKWGRAPIGLRLYAPSLANDPAFVDWYQRAQRAGGTPSAARAWFEMTRDIDVRRILSAIGVPTLVLHRVGDRALPIESSRFAASSIPDARLIELPGDDHFWFSGKPDEILDEIEEFLSGQRPAAEIDRVLTTILFTDIVGSTERAAQLGDHAWRQLLDRHYELTRQEIDRHRGRLHETTGDGVKATFDGPARGVCCARSIVERVRSLRLEIRVCTPGRSICTTARRAASPCISPRASRRPRPRAKRSSRYGQGPRCRLWTSVRGSRSARAQGRPRGVATLPAGELETVRPAQALQLLTRGP
jgi:hypothetical protein